MNSTGGALILTPTRYTLLLAMLALSRAVSTCNLTTTQLPSQTTRVVAGDNGTAIVSLPLILCLTEPPNPSLTPISLSSSPPLHLSLTLRRLRPSPLHPPYCIRYAALVTLHRAIGPAILTFAAASGAACSFRLPLTGAVGTTLARRRISTKLSVRTEWGKPAVIGVRGEAVQAVGGGGMVEFTVLRANAGERRLVLAFQGGRGNRVQVAEDAYWAEGGRYVSAFVMPEVGLEGEGEALWEYEVVGKGGVVKAVDMTGGFRLQFRLQPVVHAVYPQILLPKSGGYLAIHGEFSGRRPRVLIGGRLIEDDYLLRYSRSSIHVRVASGIVHAQVKMDVGIVVVEEGMLRSQIVNLTVDPDAIDVEAIVMHSSFDKKNGVALVSSFCNRNQAPVIFASTHGLRRSRTPPTYSFLLHASSTEPGEWQELSTGSRSLAMIDAGLFSHSVESFGEVATIRVRVKHGERVGESILFVSRSLRNNTVGLTVLSRRKYTAERRHPVVLEASALSMVQCPSAEYLSVETVWNVDGKRAVPSLEPMLPDVPGKASVYGMGDSVAVSGEQRLRFEASTTVRQRHSGEIVAEGLAVGMLRSDESRKPLRIILSGGLASTMHSVGRRLLVESSILDFPSANAGALKLRYSWTCVALNGDDRKCPTSVFPFASRAAVSNTSRLTIYGSNSDVGNSFEYTLLASHSKGESRSPPLRISFRSRELPQAPQGRLMTAFGYPRLSSSRNHLSFAPYEDIILSLSVAYSRGLNFALFRDGSNVDLLNESDTLISHLGYWTRARSAGKYLGIRNGTLAAGHYTLYGAIGEDAGRNGGSSWTFGVAESERLILSAPPVFEGVLNSTAFYAAANSVPSSANLFFFYLTKTDRRVGESESVRGTCLGRCSGAQVVSFVIQAAGVYILSVDMFDPTGSRRLATERSSVRIVVRASEFLDHVSTSLQMRMKTAVQQNDEAAFLDAVEALSRGDEVIPTSFGKVLNTLSLIARSFLSSPVRALRVLEICNHFLTRNDISLDSVVTIIGIVQDSVQRNSLSAPVGQMLLPLVAAFYGKVADRFLKLSRGRDDITSPRVQRFYDKAKTAALRDIVFLLTAGRECGYVGRAVVSRDVENDGGWLRSDDTLASLYDDYRAGISCNGGQIASLSPHPALSEACLSNMYDMQDDGERVILSSVERHELSEAKEEENVLSGPTVYTTWLRWKSGEETRVLEEASQEKDNCFRSRVSVFVGDDALQNTNHAGRDSTLKCKGAGRVLSSAAGKRRGAHPKDDVSMEVGEFVLYSDGRISTYVKDHLPSVIRMQINTTMLQVCLREPSLKGQVQARSVSVWASILGALGLFVAVLCIVVGHQICCFVEREKYFAPRQAAGSDSFATSAEMTRSTASISTDVPDAGNPVSHECEVAYSSLSEAGERDVGSILTHSTDSSGQIRRDALLPTSSHSSDGRARSEAYSNQTLEDTSAASITEIDTPESLADLMTNSSSRILDSFEGSSSRGFFIPDVFGRGGIR